METTLGWRHFRVTAVKKLGKQAAMFLLLQASCDSSTQLWVSAQTLRNRGCWAAGWLTLTEMMDGGATQPDTATASSSSSSSSSNADSAAGKVQQQGQPAAAGAAAAAAAPTQPLRNACQSCAGVGWKACPACGGRGRAQLVEL
jgi:tryptophan-rich hypothetical protein